ncbi:pilus assembly PilX family protein [Ralstonia sp. R-29]|uniref:pilus assembly PilX family protein n=1 Tax=Ralstonia sp. R-29 TaxID=3404059 RepID=UPI003CF8FFAE
MPTKPNIRPGRSLRIRLRRRQSGIVLLIALIAVVILAIGTVALFRSSDAALFNAGNLAFKRDMTNRGELGIVAAKAALTSGALNSESVRQSDQAASGYYATMQTTDKHGVPDNLVELATAVLNTKINGGDGITIYYMIDRLCTATGSTDPSNACVVSSIGSAKGGTVLPYRGQAQPPSVPVYRISVRVDGPRNSQTFLQTTVSL